MTRPVVCVTGAASGIGAAICARLRAEGARIIGLDIRPAAENVDDFIEIDLMDSASINRAAGLLPRRLDALCNVAGIAPCGDAARVLQVNFYGARRLTLGALDRMRDGGAITNVASLAGMRWRSDLARAIAALDVPDDASAEALRQFCIAHAISDVASYAFSKQLLIVWTKRMSAALALHRGRSVSTASVQALSKHRSLAISSRRSARRR